MGYLRNQSNKLLSKFLGQVQIHVPGASIFAENNTPTLPVEPKHGSNVKHISNKQTHAEEISKGSVQSKQPHLCV